VTVYWLLALANKINLVITELPESSGKYLSTANCTKSIGMIDSPMPNANYVIKSIRRKLICYGIEPSKILQLAVIEI